MEGWFVQNGLYLSELFGSGADPSRVEHFVKGARLSRYVGVLRWFLDGEALADVVCDTTDIRRDPTPYVPILGMFFCSSSTSDRFLLRERLWRTSCRGRTSCRERFSHKSRGVLRRPRPAPKVSGMDVADFD